VLAAVGWVSRLVAELQIGKRNLDRERAADMSGFGWNFYAYFVVAVAWVMVYFCWARWMTERERKIAERDEGELRAKR
jgi:hypothetical protein